MKEKLYLFALDIAKLGDDKIYETLHILAYNTAHASHLGFHMLNDEDNDRYDFPAEIVNVRKELGIKEIINAFDYSEESDEIEHDSEQPFKVIENPNFPQEHIIKFKCLCQNELKVADYNWGMINCPDCKRRILRKDLELVGGLWINHSHDD